MASQIIINASFHETRVALLENDIIQEFYIGRKNEKGIAGNIYKGRVLRVLPGMQAAFVDIGLEKAAFLFVADIQPQNAIKEKSALDLLDIGDDSNLEFPDFGKNLLPIQDILKENQEILVQVSKDPIGTKGARVTSYISLPGRNIVLMPTVDHIGISRKIGEIKERKRLKEIIQKIKPLGMGCIVRTVSEFQSLKKLKSDSDYLIRLWREIQKRNQKSKAPMLIHKDLDLSLRVIRDLLNEDVNRLVVDSEYEFKNILKFVNQFLPRLRRKIELYKGKEPIFDSFGIELEINRALGKKIWLKSGGYIIIEQTEALTVIDVNTGKFVGKRNLEDTILKTNLEASKEIAYQIKLRNCGGIIIVDFIDMEKQTNRNKVLNTLNDILKKDKAKVSVVGMTGLGLVELTRKRVRESLIQTLCEPCGYCDGRGFIKSKITTCQEIFRELIREFNLDRSPKFTLFVHPDVANLLFTEQRHGIEEIEHNFNIIINIKAETAFHSEQFEILRTYEK